MKDWACGVFVVHRWGKSGGEITSGDCPKTASGEVVATFPGPDGRYDIEVKLFAKNNHSSAGAKWWLKVNSSQVGGGTSPAGGGCDQKVGCSSTGSKVCVSTCVTNKAASGVSLKTGDKIIFGGTTSWPCGCGSPRGGYYTGFSSITLVGQGTPTPVQPKLSLNQSTIAISVAPAKVASPLTVQASNSGTGTLPALSVEESASWLSVKVEGTGNTQRLINTGSGVNLTPGQTLTTTVTVKGTGITSVTYNVSLKVQAQTFIIRERLVNRAQNSSVARDRTIFAFASSSSGHLVQLIDPRGVIVAEFAGNGSEAYAIPVPRVGECMCYAL